MVRGTTRGHNAFVTTNVWSVFEEADQGGVQNPAECGVPKPQWL